MERELEGKRAALGLCRAFSAEDDALEAPGDQAQQAPRADEGARRKGGWVYGAGRLQEVPPSKG